MFVSSPDSRVEFLMPDGTAFIGESRMNGISTLIKELPPPPPKKGQREDICEPEVGPQQTPHKSASQDLGRSSPRNCEKQISVVYKPPSLWYVAVAAQTD